MIATAGVGLLACAAALTLGAGVLRACGQRAWQPAAGAVGLGALLVICSVAIRLPGRGLVAALALAALLGASAVWLGLRERPRPGLAPLMAGTLAAAAACIPFVASGRLGTLGVGVNNDMARHLLWADALRFADVAALHPLPSGYALGTDALAGTLATLTGTGAEQAYNGLAVAALALTALVALGLLDGLSPPRRGLGAALVGTSYLLVSYHSTGAPREVIVALLVLGFAVALRAILRGRPPGVWAALPLAVISAGLVYEYGYFGLLWPAGTLGAWLVLEILLGPRGARPGAIPDRARRLTGRLRGRGGTLIVAAGALLVLIAPEISNSIALFGRLGLSPAGVGAIEDTELGPLIAALPAYQAGGLWPAPDFRQPTSIPFSGGGLAFDPNLVRALAVAAILWGLAWALRRRDRVVLAVTAAAALVYLVTRLTESPYVAAKALVVLSVPVMAMTARALLEPLPDPGRLRAALHNPGRALVDALLIGAAVLVLCLALGSSLLALEGGPVGTDAQQRQVQRLAGGIREPTLFLANDDEFVDWDLARVPIRKPATLVRFEPWLPLRPAKSWDLRLDFGLYDQFDFDTVEPRVLDRFRYAITTDTPYASRPPANFRPAGAAGSFRLWRRVGPTVPREVLMEGSAPGARGPCGVREPGRAAILPRPRVVDVSRSIGLGHSTAVPVTLPGGRWVLSLQYTSPQALGVRAAGLERTLPPYMARAGPFWKVGRVAVPRRTRVRIVVEQSATAPLRPVTQQALVKTLVATRAGARERMVPRSAACGRYVDWLSPAR